MAVAVQRNPTRSVSTTKADKAAKAIQLIKPARRALSPLNMAVYGRNGAGKTHFAGSSELKTLIVDCNEKGFETLRNRPNVDVFEVDQWDQLDWIYWHLRTNDHPYQVVAIDTITMLANMCMKWILGEASSRDTSVDPKMPDKRHWGKLAITLGDIIINWRNLPIHTLFLAQERVNVPEDEEEGSGLVEVVPSLSKAPLSSLLAAVGTVGRIYTREVVKEVEKTTPAGKKIKVKKSEIERRMLLGPDQKYAGKTRIQGVPRIVINPNLGKLLEIRARLGEVAPGMSTDTAEELNA